MCFAYTQAQEIIKEPQKAKPKKDTIKKKKNRWYNSNCYDYNILESDIDKSFRTF